MFCEVITAKMKSRKELWVGWGRCLNGAGDKSINGRGKGKCCIFYLISTIINYIYMKAKGRTLWEERGTNKGGDWEGFVGDQK